MVVSLLVTTRGKSAAPDWQHVAMACQHRLHASAVGLAFRPLSEIARMVVITTQATGHPDLGTGAGIDGSACRSASARRARRVASSITLA